MMSSAIVLLEAVSNILAYIIKVTPGKNINKIFKAIKVIKTYDPSFTEEEIMFLFEQQVKKFVKIQNNSKEISNMIEYSLSIINNDLMSEEKKIFVKQVYSVVLFGEIFSEDEINFGKYMLDSFSLNLDLAHTLYDELINEISFDPVIFTRSDNNNRNAVLPQTDVYQKLYNIHDQFVKRMPIIINHELPQINNYEKLNRKFSDKEIRKICESIRTKRIIPYFEFIPEILSQRFNCDFDKISWFLPKVTLYNRINCSLYVDEEAIYANTISGNEMIPVFKLDEIDSIDVTCKKTDNPRRREFRFRLLLQSYNNTCLTIDLIEDYDHDSQLSIVAEILSLYKEIFDHQHPSFSHSYSILNLPKLTSFDSWESFITWFE